MIIADIFNRVYCGTFPFVPVLGIKRFIPLHLFVSKKTKQQQIWMWLGERFVFHSSMCSIIRKMCIYYRKVHDFYPFIYFPWYFQVFHDLADPVLYFLQTFPLRLYHWWSLLCVWWIKHRYITVTCASIHAANPPFIQRCSLCESHLIEMSACVTRRAFQPAVGHKRLSLITSHGFPFWKLNCIPPICFWHFHKETSLSLHS